MKIRTSALLCGSICIAGILMPLGIFRMQDSVLSDKSVAWKSSTEDIAKKYPVIASVYANFYQEVSETYDENMIDLSNISSYTAKEQKELQTIRSRFSEELTAMLTSGVFPYQLLEMKKPETYSIAFGTLTHKDDNRGIYSLNQVFRLNSNEDNIADYTMDKQTGKLLHLEFDSRHAGDYSEQQRKNFAWEMIRYLKLDTIDDWTYTQNGYESYRAKVQVYCDVSKFSDTGRFILGITPLGQHTDSSLYIYG